MRKRTEKDDLLDITEAAGFRLGRGWKCKMPLPQLQLLVDLIRFREDMRTAWTRSFGGKQK